MEALVQEQLKDIEKILKKQLSGVKFVGELEKAINYVIFPGGKRIRPLFSLMLAGDLKVKDPSLIEAAVSVEYIHAASLVHDDLPAMDDDDIRRGRPSCHKAFKEATAILVGDVLMVLPYEIISDLNITSEQKQSIVSVLAKAFRYLCIGQEMDIAGGYNPLEVYKGKTGALFEASAKITAIVGGFCSEVVELSGKLGLTLGIYFQVVDDLIDAKGIKGRGGAGSDLKNQKETFINKMSVGKIEQKIAGLKEEIDNILKMLKEKTVADDFAGVRYILSMVENSLKGKRSTKHVILNRLI